jgi:hypothetical protein
VQIPADSEVAELARHYAELLQELDPTEEKPLLVLPNGEFFPDTFRGDEASVNALAARMQGYAGLEAIELQVRLIDDAEGAPSPAGCGSGACGGPALGGIPRAKLSLRIRASPR